MISQYIKHILAREINRNLLFVTNNDFNNLFGILRNAESAVGAFVYHPQDIAVGISKNSLLLFLE